jgi:ATP-dependent helicase/nuclease subunit A
MKPHKKQLVPDQAARDRIASELNVNLIVEAGAGSGKTKELSGRMAAGIASGDYELEGMAAVTFTRKAAAELRGRFQLVLERELAAGGDGERQNRIRRALANIERFFAGTIHAFCARLLRERPVEAGVSPGFTEVDEMEERLLRQQAWRDYRLQAHAAGDAHLLELTDAGISAKHLDKAFETVCLYEDVAFPAGAAAMPDLAANWAALEKFWTTLTAMLPSPVPADATCKAIEKAGQFARQWRGFVRGRRDAVLLTSLMRMWESTPKVVQRCWASKSIAKDAERVWAEFRTSTVQPYLAAWRQYVYARCIALLVKARDAAKAERRRRNTLSFNDLLLLTAEVLRTNASVRRALQRKYRWLFVDEFQDTDPIQAEIMFLLAAKDASQPKPGNARASGAATQDGCDWRGVELRPGALFVVGDPKQSIYRFRRADIDIYNEVRERLGGPNGANVIRLTTNFRSAAGLCEWANAVFAQQFPAAPTAHAPAFGPLAPDPNRKAGYGPHLAAMDVPAAVHSSQVACEEAGYIARYIQSEVAAGRRKHGDFLILTRRKKRLRPYADALESLGVPIEVTGAGAFADSDEVRELSLLLLALADPQDAVALVGVLRGPLFGLSDRDLFAYKQAGGYFGLFAKVETEDAGAGRVAAALEQLRRWHRWTRLLPAGAALERVLEDSGYLALAAAPRGGVEAGDLLHAVDRVRAVVSDGFTLAAAAKALAGWCALEDEAVEDSSDVDSLPLEPGRSDVVRLMNVHKAKGLEASVVFLADPLGGYESPVDIRIVRDGSEARGYFRMVEVKDWATRPIAEPPEWERHEADEKPYLEAELDRLFYVAATRAKNLLVIGRYVGGSGKNPAWPLLTAALGDAPALEIPGAVARAEPPIVDLSMATASQAAADIAAAHERSRQPSWSTMSVTAELKRLPRAALADADPSDPTQVVVPKTTSHRADAGAAWGSLVHGLLEHAMRHRGAAREDLRRLAQWLTMEEPQLRAVIDQAVDTALAVVSSDELAAARATAECHEEVPFAVRAPGVASPHVVTGVIDLVHRHGAEWRVLDYKTDVDGGTAAPKYAEQVRAYGDAWGRISGVAVKTAIISAR